MRFEALLRARAIRLNSRRMVAGGAVRSSTVSPRGWRVVVVSIRREVMGRLLLVWLYRGEACVGSCSGTVRTAADRARMGIHRSTQRKGRGAIAYARMHACEHVPRPAARRARARARKRALQRSVRQNRITVCIRACSRSAKEDRRCVCSLTHACRHGSTRPCMQERTRRVRGTCMHVRKRVRSRACIL